MGCPAYGELADAKPQWRGVVMRAAVGKVLEG